MIEATDIQQYLDENGLVDEDHCRDMPTVIFLTAIIESATENYRLPLSIADVECMEIYDDELCLGEVEVWIYAESDHIGWECTKCAEAGAVSNWQGTRWDKRDMINH